MTPATFARYMSRLRFIDHYKVEEWMSRHEWLHFRDHPFEYFIGSSDETRAKLWDIITEGEK